MKNNSYKLIFCLLMLAQILSQQIVYIDNTQSPGGSGTISSPYSSLDEALGHIPTGGSANQFMILVKMNNIQYSITNQYNFTGISLNFQTSDQSYVEGSYLSSQDSCSKLPFIGLNGGSITADSLSFKGLGFYASNNLSNFFFFAGSQFNLSDICFQVNSYTQSSVSNLNMNQNLSILNPPNDTNQTYLFAVQGNGANSTNVVLKNIYIYGMMPKPALLWARNLNQIEIVNLSSNSFPTLSISTNSLLINTFNIDGGGNLQKNPFSYQANNYCLTKISYYSTASISNIQVSNLKGIGAPYFLCVYQAAIPSSFNSQISEQKFALNTVNFINNTFSNVNSTWSFIYFRVTNSLTNIQYETSLANLNAANNIITSDGLTSPDSFLITLYPAGNISITGVSLTNNTNLKSISADESNFLTSNLIFLSGAAYVNNTWRLGQKPILSFSINPKMQNINATIYITQITFTNNINSVSFFNLESGPTSEDFDETYAYFWPQVWFLNLNMVNNNLRNLVMFTFQRVNLNFNDASIFSNTFISSDLLQNLASPASFQISNVTITLNSFSDSNLIVKQFDTSKPLSDMISSLNVDTTPVPYAIYINNFYLQSSTFAAYSTAFSITGAPYIFITQSQFSNLSFYSSTLIMASDLLSPLENIILDANYILNNSYPIYLSNVGNQNLTSAFYQSLPISPGSQFDLNYAIGNLTNGLVFIYRIYSSTFENLFFNQSNVFDISTISLNQSLVSIDTNTFNNLTLFSYQDSMIKASSVISLNFGNNYITAFNGIGFMLTTDQIPYLTIIYNSIYNNQGSSLLRLTADATWNILISYNTGKNISCLASFITMSIQQNFGQIIFNNNAFDNLYIVSDPKAYRQLNFLSVDIELSSNTEGDIPDVYIYQSTFTNSVIYKNHPLIKQYENAFININLAKDLFRVENCKFNNISILYDNNLLIAISDEFELLNTTFSNIQNFETCGAVYILAANITITDSIFINNSAPIGNGGALYVDFDSVIDSQVFITLTNSFFSNNVAADGSVFYYSGNKKSINFNASNNIFINNMVSSSGGSMIEIANAIVLGFIFEQNSIQYSQDTPMPTVFLNFNSLNASDNVDLEISDLTVSMNSNVLGSFIQTINTNAEFILENLTIYEIGTSYPELFNAFSLMNLRSGLVTLVNSSIYNISTSSSLILLSCNEGTNAQFQVQNSSFYNLTLMSQSTTNIDITDSGNDANMGIIHISSVGGKTICTDSILVQNTTFQNLNQFIPNTQSFATSAITVDYNGQFQLNVQNSKFFNLNSAQGPAVSLLNTQETSNQVIIQNNLFSNMTSNLEGGTIYNSVNSMLISGNQFVNSCSLTASGAAIFSDGPLDFDSVLQQNIFLNVSRYFSYFFIDNNPIGTSPIQLNFTFTTPSYVVQTYNNGTPVLSNLTSDDLSNINISSILVDGLNQRVYDTTLTQQTSKGLSVEITGQLGGSDFCYYGQCQMSNPNIVIKAPASQYIEANVIYKSAAFQITTSTFGLILRPCMNGEINSTLLDPNDPSRCTLCGQGTYSLDATVDTECNQCPSSAECPGGSIVILNPGYWRSNTSTDLILRCENEDACLGGYDSACAKGYAGPTCGSCLVDDRWVKDQSNCSQCPPTGRSMIILIVLSVVTIGYQVWYIKSARTSNTFFIAYYDNKVDTAMGMKIELYITQGMYIRLLTTYAQIILIIGTFRLDFSQLFGNAADTTVQTVANPSSTLFYSSTCAFLDFGFDPTRLVYYKIAFVALSPLIKIGGLYILRLLFWRFRVNDKRASILLVTGICLILMEQPSATQQLFTFINCIQLEPPNGPYYLQQDFGYECYTSDYYFVLYVLIIPAIIFYCILIPGALLTTLIVNRKNLNNPKLRLNLGAIYNEYQPKAYFWGICLMGTKLILMFLKSTLYNDVKTKALSIFIVLYIYYALYVKFKPYQRKDLFFAENIALIDFLFTIFGSIYYKDNVIPPIQWLTLATIFLLNVYVIGLLFWKVLRIYFVQIRDVVKPMLRNFRKKNVKVDINFLDDNFVSDDEEDISLEKVEEKIFNGEEKDSNNQDGQITDVENSFSESIFPKPEKPEPESKKQKELELAEL